MDLSVHRRENIAVGYKYVLVAAVAVLCSFVFHELAHWLAGEALGYKMGMSLNSAYPLAGDMQDKRHAHLVSAAGPLFTILQSLLVYVLLIRGRSLLLYPFLFVPLYMRLLAGIMNVFVLNDEGRIGSDLGLGTYTLSIAACLIIGLMIYHVSVRRGLTRKFQLINFFLAMVFTSVLILANQYLNVQLIS